MRHSRRETDREQGQIIVLFAMALVVILAFGAIVVDLGLLRNNRQILANTLDSAALAGGTLLPVDGSKVGQATAAHDLIVQNIAANYPSLVENTDYTIQYRCLIGADSTGPLVARDVPATCNPTHAVGHIPVAADFHGAGLTRVSLCDPNAGDLCNLVLITGHSTTPFSLGPVVGVKNGSTGDVVSAACNGPCGAAQPLVLNDVELVIDKSGSMSDPQNNSGTPSSPRIYWAKQAASQFVTDLSTNGGIGATGNRLGITTFSGTTASSAPTAWTSTAAQLTATINGITASGTTPTRVGLNTGSADLIGHARNAVGGTVKRVIILLSDGRPNPDQGPNGKVATSAVNNMRPTQADLNTYLGSADVAYSILIGTSPTLYPVGKVPPPQLDPNIVDPDMMKFLATPDKPAAPPAPAQTYFFNVVDASGLPSVFHQIASQILTHHAQLVQVYPTPIVTSLSQTAGTYVGGNTLTINGQYLNDAQNVTFGGVPAVVVSVSDSAITVRAPAGTNGQTVDVVVTTLGGTSPITSADQYTYN